MRVELSSGNWAELRDPETFTRGDRKDLRRRLEATGKVDYPDDTDRNYAYQDSLLAGFLSAWSFAEGLPPSKEFLDGLCLADDDALERAVTRAFSVLFPDFAPQVVAASNGVATIERSSPTSPS